MTGVYRVGDLRVWRLILPAPCELWSANDAHRANRFEVSRIRKQWRTAAYELCQQAQLPRGLKRISLALAFHPCINNRRDALNYADTAKPIIDGFGPPFLQKPTKKKPAGASAPGWSLIPDDTPEHLESVELSIGPLWQHIVPQVRTAAAVNALDRKWGGVTIVIQELPARDTTPEPLPAPLTAEERRAILLKEVIG